MLFYEDDPVYFKNKGIKTPGIIIDIFYTDEPFDAGDDISMRRYTVHYKSPYKNSEPFSITLKHYQIVLAEEFLLDEKLKEGDKVVLLDDFPFKMTPYQFNGKINSFDKLAGAVLTVRDVEWLYDEDYRTPIYSVMFEDSSINIMDYDINISKTKSLNLLVSKIGLRKLPFLPIIK